MVLRGWDHAGAGDHASLSTGNNKIITYTKIFSAEFICEM